MIYESQMAELIKNWKPAPFNVYLKLTATTMPEYLASRLYIDGRGEKHFTKLVSPLNQPFGSVQRPHCIRLMTPTRCSCLKSGRRRHC